MMIIQFIAENWIDLLLVIVGASAFATYCLQERRKISDAASLIILQVEDMQIRIAEIGSFIINGQLNDSAFYESQILFTTDYWNEYKHYFTRKIDSFSFRVFDSFYHCAAEILEQQQLMKNLQKNGFFSTQQILMQIESNYIISALTMCEQNPVDIPQLVQAMESSIPKEVYPEQKKAVENMLKQMVASNSNPDLNAFWNIYGKRKNDLHSVINQNALTHYIPTQIRITLENALKQINSIQIIGCDGYRRLKKLGQRKL